MKNLNGKVAVVTGAASGVGLAMAHRFADEGMKIVLADIEAETLHAAEGALRAKGVETLAVTVDVMSEPDVTRLADAAFERFDNVHLLCNNAGVAPTRGLNAAWDAPKSDWEWVMGVNFMGVLHGVRAFVPRMLAAGAEGHIVNTASVAGMLTSSNAYNVSKHAVVCLTEGMYKDFRVMGAKLSASALCPGWIRTQIMEAERNRPAQFGARTDPSTLGLGMQQFRDRVRNFVDTGYEPSEIAKQVIDAVREDRFYVMPVQPWIMELVKTRLQDVIEQRNPTLPPAM